MSTQAMDPEIASAAQRGDEKSVFEHEHAPVTALGDLKDDHKFSFCGWSFRLCCTFVITC